MPEKFVFERVEPVQQNSGYSQCVAEIGLEYLFHVLLLVMLNVCVPRHGKHMYEKSTDSHKQFRKQALFPKTYGK